MKLEFIEARDLPDAWFQCVYRLLETGREYTIERGSYEGQKRLEFDYATIQIKYPGVRPLLPDIPPALGIPNPVADGYLEEYLPYLMTSAKEPGEDYTYGERLAGDGCSPDQIQKVIDMYKNDGYGTNQACMSISQPSDINLKDPPCILPESYIITAGGVKYAKDVNVGESVLSHDGKFHRVKKVFKRFYNGTIYKLSKYSNFCTYVTTNHPIWGINNVKTCPYDKDVVYKLTCESNCAKQESVYEQQGKNCPKLYNDYKLDWTDIQNCSNFYVPSVIIHKDLNYNDDFLADKFRLYGYFLADGNLLKPDKRDEGLTFAINKHDLYIISDIEHIFNKVYNKKVTKYYNNNLCRLYVYSKELCKEFKQMFYDVPKNFDKGKGNGKYTCYYKVFPVEFLRLPAEIQKELLLGLSSGDGHLTKDGDTSIYVTSEKLAVLLIAMLNSLYPTHSGYIRKCYGQSIIDGRHIISRKNGYVFIYRDSNSTYNRQILNYKNNSNKYNCRKLNIEKSINYSGYVYNFEIDKSQSYIVDGYLPAHNCLRSIDTRIKDGKLHFMVYFRSWDLWNGFPANLGAIQLLKEYMAGSIGVEDGQIIASSKGLHLYDYVWELARLRTFRQEVQCST